MITVIIPLYNKEKSILDTVYSVLNQTYKDFELLIINDGSKDNSLKVVQGISDPRVAIIDKPNGGVSSARNAGILNAKNEYLAFLDGDDIWHPEHLKILSASLSQLDNETVGGVGTSFYKSNIKEFDESKFKEEKPEIIKDYFDFMSSPVSRFNSSTLLVKKTKVLKTGLFDENLSYGEDVEFWYRLFSDYALIYNKTITTIYFVGAENRSAHYVMPLNKRFHLFDYKNKTASEKKYLDKLVALILVDYFGQKAYKQVLFIAKMYFGRLFGAFGYLFNIIKKKMK
ncbi:glycosyltransferase family 2 protein [Chryseobacterium sp. KMC2]|uniref:glycosyltransferase family 2 protein n=1 Tax=Chryseobacterium sp. KMC2 TaxID=2800705 RepID=UPI001923F860|nr:glycosyltransferase family A protein [Chryseobacterium sp. KMC2]MBL3546565.1 glycosyltransferase family 2 protein [Chryseobacterium sp. KMC2]